MANVFKNIGQMLTDFMISQKQPQLSKNSLITIKTKHAMSTGHIRCRAILSQLVLNPHYMWIVTNQTSAPLAETGVS